MTAGTQVSLAAAAAPDSAAGLRRAIERAADGLLDLQSPDGYWCGELEADTTLESDYILYQLWMDPPGPAGPWLPRRADRVEHAARYIRDRQTPTGGWNLFPGGPDNLSASVKAYFALKLAGDSPDKPHLEAARRRILDLGGLESANSYTRIYLSFFGLAPRELTPTIPPELILLGPDAYINIYEMSSWTRAIVVPLAILSALRPARPVPAGFTLRELYSGRPPEPTPRWSRVGAFWTLDRLFKLWERSGFLPQRTRAIRECEKWILERLEGSGGLGAIFPSMLNSILALHELGYAPDHPALARAIDAFEALAIHERGTLRLQPCCSPVWDTVLAAFALGLADADAAALRRAADWILSKEVRRPGDWSVKNRRAAPGGWYFEFANESYPDVDDTAMALLALRHAPASDPAAQRAAEGRALDWIISMQSTDGGWAAFDVDNNRAILTHVPFADHNAMLDPSCPDITGRVIEAISPLAKGSGPVEQAVRGGLSYLRRSQESDGSWTGRWGVNYIYGTCFALRGLHAAGVDPREAAVIQAGEWIRSVQNADGGWGESCASYDDPTLKGVGTSTASQTAWALMALFATGDYSTSTVTRGVRYLLETQDERGGWQDASWTGTGFPSVFYLKYHLYSRYFPLMALAEYAARDSGANR